MENENNELELSWLMRFRIAAALAIGIGILGIGGWKLVSPNQPIAIVSIISSSIGPIDILLCCCLAFAAGFAASIIAAPYGKQIGILAAPAGLAFWAAKSGSLAKTFQAVPAADARADLYSSLQFEGFIWLMIAAAGFIGAILGHKIMPKKDIDLPDKFKPYVKLPNFAVIIITVIAAVFIAEKLICIIAQDVSYTDAKMSVVFGNPSASQIALAVLVGFGSTAFLAKLFLGADFLWSAIATVPLVYYISTIYGKTELLEYMSTNWPAMFFAKPSAAILPIQIVAFGTIGAVWGYWLAVRFHTWRTIQQ